jgi:cytochrome c5
MFRVLLLMVLAAPAAAQTGGEIYKDHCAACHDNGESRAPRPGVVADWESRVKKGRPALIRAATGVAPHATGASAAQVTAAVDYLLSIVDILVNSYSEPPRLESGK